MLGIRQRFLCNMLSSFRFHHIGLAVKDIDATAALYVAGGYRCSAKTIDNAQNVIICWLTKEGSPILELVAPINDQSPINSTLEKVGVTPYHCCYVVDDIDTAVCELRKQRYIMVSKPVEAPAFCGSRVCFLYNKNIGLIELVEAPAIIVE